MFHGSRLLGLYAPWMSQMIRGASNNLLADGDMEASGVAAWSKSAGATLTKETGTPHGGAQCLRIAGNVNQYAYQVIMTTGKTYRITGFAGGDGVSSRLQIWGTATLAWQGTSSASWQQINARYTADGPVMYFLVGGGNGYVEIDDMRVVRVGG